MKIGYMIWSQPIGLDATKETLRHITTDWMRTLVEMGHELVLYTDVKKRDMHLLDQSDQFDGLMGLIGATDSWTKKLDYQPYEMPSTDVVDCLLVESSSKNLRFTNALGRSRAQFSAEQIGAFDGTVFLLHWDAALPFIWNKMFQRGVSWSQRETIPKERWEYDICYSEPEYVKGKDVVLLSCGMHTDMVKEHKIFNGARVKYAEAEFTVEYLPQGWDWKTRNVEISQEVDNFLVYLGKPKRRRIKLRNYYAKAGVPTRIFGKWRDVDQKGFEDVEFPGFAPSASKTINRSVVQFCVTDNGTEEIGWINGRVFETVSWGAILLSEEDNVASREVVKDDWIVKDRDDALRKYAYLHELDRDAQIEIVEDQREFLSYRDMKWSIGHFEDIAKKYGVM